MVRLDRLGNLLGGHGVRLCCRPVSRSAELRGGVLRDGTISVRNSSSLPTNPAVGVAHGVAVDPETLTGRPAPRQGRIRRHHRNSLGHGPGAHHAGSAGRGHRAAARTAARAQRPGRTSWR